jgi:hypothetical protein
MTTTPKEAYPLSWPEGWPRTRPQDQRADEFVAAHGESVSRGAVHRAGAHGCRPRS